MAQAPVANLVWEVPLSRYFEACSLVAEASRLSDEGSLDKLAELVEQIRRFPGYPHNRGPDDLVVVVPANAKIYITPAPQGVN